MGRDREINGERQVRKGGREINCRRLDREREGEERER